MYDGVLMLYELQAQLALAKIFGVGVSTVPFMLFLYSRLLQIFSLNNVETKFKPLKAKES